MKARGKTLVFFPVRCPTCKTTFGQGESRYAPFCSQRCKLIDLGKWLDGDYAVPSDEPVSEEEIAEELLKRVGREPQEH